MKNYHIRAHEGGSLVTFLVVGLVLAALVVGGVYTVQRKGQQTPEAPKSSPSASKAPVASSASPKPTPSSQKSKAPAPVVTPSHAPSAKAPNSSRLPATGPSENFVSILMLAGLVGIVIAYIRSRSAQRFAYQVD